MVLSSQQNPSRRSPRLQRRRGLRRRPAGTTSSTNPGFLSEATSLMIPRFLFPSYYQQVTVTDASTSSSSEVNGNANSSSSSPRGHFQRHGAAIASEQVQDCDDDEGLHNPIPMMKEQQRRRRKGKRRSLRMYVLKVMDHFAFLFGSMAYLAADSWDLTDTVVYVEDDDHTPKLWPGSPWDVYDLLQLLGPLFYLINALLSLIVAVSAFKDERDGRNRYERRILRRRRRLQRQQTPEAAMEHGSISSRTAATTSERMQEEEDDEEQLEEMDAAISEWRWEAVIALVFGTAAVMDMFAWGFDDTDADTETATYWSFAFLAVHLYVVEAVMAVSLRRIHADDDDEEEEEDADKEEDESTSTTSFTLNDSSVSNGYHTKELNGGTVEPLTRPIDPEPDGIMKVSELTLPREQKSPRSRMSGSLSTLLGCYGCCCGCTVNCFQQLGDALFLLGSIIDMVLVYYDRDSSNEVLMTIWSLVSSTLWFVDAILLMSVDMCCQTSSSSSSSSQRQRQGTISTMDQDGIRKVNGSGCWSTIPEVEMMMPTTSNSNGRALKNDLSSASSFAQGSCLEDVRIV